MTTYLEARYERLHQARACDDASPVEDFDEARRVLTLHTGHDCAASFSALRSVSAVM